MRVAVDARSLLPVQPGLGPTGVGRWTAGVVGGLARVAPEWSIELVLIHKDGEVDPTRFGSNVSFHPVRVSDRWQRRLSIVGLWPRIDRFIGPHDVLLGPGYVTWKSSGAEIPVLHDLTHVRHPQYMSPRNLWYMRLMLDRSIARARLIATVSGAMRDEITDHYAIDRERIAVVPNGFDPQLVDRAAQVSLPASIPEEFLLFVGTLEPRKNLIGTLKGLEIAIKEAPGAIPPLVIAGGRGWRDEDIAAALAAFPEGAVIRAGFIDDDVLFALYRKAAALLFPSFYEGFGLPVLEAMACGCPVITSRAGGIPEVAGEAALFVDPSDPHDIGSAIVRLTSDESERKRLMAAGPTRAATFTWDASGRALMEAIRRATA